jgi:hypothetical protein
MTIAFCAGVAVGLLLMLAALRFSRAACRWSGIERAVLDAWYDDEYGTPCQTESRPPSDEEVAAIVHDGWPEFLALAGNLGREAIAKRARMIDFRILDPSK